MNRIPGEVPRIGRAADDPGYATNHGPVEQETKQGAHQVLSFVGGEESDILHAAADWMLEHGPRHRMQMVVNPG